MLISDCERLKNKHFILFCKEVLEGSLTNVLMRIQNVLLVTKNFGRFESDYGAANTIVSVVSC